MSFWIWFALAIFNAALWFTRGENDTEFLVGFWACLILANVTRRDQ